MLELEAVQAFLHVAELLSFTRAAEALETTQSAVSLRLQRLERQLGRRLIERTPRSVRLSADGLVFLPAARELLAAQARALGVFGVARRRLVIGISYHVVGPELPLLPRRMNARDPTLLVEMRLAASHEVLRDFDAEELDAAVLLRHESNRRAGETLCREPLGWFGVGDYAQGAGEPLRLATHAAPCGLRAIATEALDRAGKPWTEVFIGGGVATITAAIAAGLAVAALVRRTVPAGLEEVTERLSLPPLPVSETILHARATEPHARAALQAFAAAFRATARP